MDFTELQEQVMRQWEIDGVPYFDEDEEGRTVTAHFDEILSDPMSCIEELGYSKYSDYVREI
jgi:hypothetical protein